MPGKFNLNDYIDVQDRINRFWTEYPDGAIRTTLESDANEFEHVVFRADVYKNRDNTGPDATGYAAETKGQGGMANSTSWHENGETSAIGRALANMGYATSGKDRPSRQEMEKAVRTPVARDVAPGRAETPNAAPDTPENLDREKAMRALHAAANERGFSHDELRLIADNEERTATQGERGIASMKDAPTALLVHVKGLIETKPDDIRRWLATRKAQQAELNPDLNAVPNPKPADHYTRMN